PSSWNCASSPARSARTPSTRSPRPCAASRRWPTSPSRSHPLTPPDSAQGAPFSPWSTPSHVLKGNDQAKRWLVLPFLDEALNAVLDVQFLASGSLPAAALLPMLGVHTFFAMGFAGVLLLERLAKRQAA